MYITVKKAQELLQSCNMFSSLQEACDLVPYIFCSLKSYAPCLVISGI